jgi:hypothetical protein
VAQRARAERTAMRAEEERMTLLDALGRKESSVRHFQALARRAFAQVTAAEDALAAAKKESKLQRGGGAGTRAIAGRKAPASPGGELSAPPTLP